MEQQVSVAVKRVGKVVAPRDLRTPHPALARLREAEARRQAKHQASGYSWDMPYFDAPMYQRQLRIFSGLVRALAPVYGRQEVDCEDKWIQGIGTLHHLVLHLHFGGVRMALQIFEPSDRGREKERKPVKATTLSIDTDRSRDGVHE